MRRRFFFFPNMADRSFFGSEVLMQATFGHEGSQDRNAAPFSDHSWRKTCVAKTKVFICDAFCFVWPSVNPTTRRGTFCLTARQWTLAVWRLHRQQSKRHPLMVCRVYRCKMLEDSQVSTVYCPPKKNSTGSFAEGVPFDHRLKGSNPTENKSRC